MNDRDRLVELLEDTFHEWEINDVQNKTIQEIAEHLIENGVIVPPCEVGDTVVTTYHGSLSVYRVTEFIINDFLWAKLYNPDYSREYETELVCLDFSFNKFVFLTSEKAEQALKERENNVK